MLISCVCKWSCSLFFSMLCTETLLSTSAVRHAAWRPWSFDGQLHQCERGSCWAARQIRPKQTPTHWTVLWHAHREDTSKLPNQTHSRHIIVLWGLTIPIWTVHIIMYSEKLLSIGHQWISLVCSDIMVCCVIKMMIYRYQCVNSVLFKQLHAPHYPAQLCACWVQFLMLFMAHPGFAIVLLHWERWFRQTTFFKSLPVYW